MKGFKKIGLTFFCLLFVPCICWGWQGKVIGIAEGDTITVLHKSKRVRIRLYGVDCPEKGQHFGENAKQFTSDMVLGKEVEVQQPTLDEYGHMAGIVSIDGDILNRELVKHGYAWVYREYCTKKECREWSRLEDEARKRKLGLWILSIAIPPWEFRHYRKMVQGKGPGEHSILIYHGDVSSHVFHAPGCKDFNCRNCIVVFKTREAAIRAGYKPCGICSP